MSKKIVGFQVVLENEISEEKFNEIETILKNLKNVAVVKEQVNCEEFWMEKTAAKHELKSTIFEFLQNILVE